LLVTILAILVSSACALASIRRLDLAVGASAVDPTTLAAALRTGPPDLWSAVKRELVDAPEATWERELVEALDAPSPGRVALVNEQLSELDYRAQRWGRVPRVCASISSSFGFLMAFATVAGVAAGDVTGDVDFGAAAMTAINVVVIGLAGAAFCIAAHLRATAVVRGRLAAADSLVESLEDLAHEEGVGHLPRLPAIGSLV
jgi:hypothetical protein